MSVLLNTSFVIQCSVTTEKEYLGKEEEEKKEDKDSHKKRNDLLTGKLQNQD